MWLVTYSGWCDNMLYYLNEHFLLKPKNLIVILFLEKLKCLHKLAWSLPIHLQVTFQDLIYNEQNILLIVDITPLSRSS